MKAAQDFVIDVAMSCVSGANVLVLWPVDHAARGPALQVHERATGGEPGVLQGPGEAGLGQATRESQLAGIAHFRSVLFHLLAQVISQCCKLSLHHCYCTHHCVTQGVLLTFLPHWKLLTSVLV